MWKVVAAALGKNQKLSLAEYLAAPQTNLGSVERVGNFPDFRHSDFLAYICCELFDVK